MSYIPFLQKDPDFGAIWRLFGTLREPNRDVWPLILQGLATWRERARMRCHLARLDDRLLRDIGLSRLDAKREINKPFWKA